MTFRHVGHVHLNYNACHTCYRQMKAITPNNDDALCASETSPSWIAHVGDRSKMEALVQLSSKS